MIAKWFGLVLCAAACGSVAGPPPAVDGAVEPADAAIDAPPPRMYRGTLAETAAVGFGGLPYCHYTITLKQLSIEVEILPGGQVNTGRAQALNVEAVVVSTMPNCPANTPVIPPNIATYTFQSAKPITGGMQLTFKGGSTNNPGVNLVVDLAAAGTGFQARLAFQRFDQPAVLNWSVVAMLSMSTP
jgi:hypothetical protein